MALPFRLQILKTKIVLIALCWFDICLVTGFTVSSSTSEPLDGDSSALESISGNDLNETFTNLSLELIKNITNQLDKSKSGLENSDNKINETELYENGQAAKENNERSFIFINQKFKSPWFDSQRSLRKSLFTSDENSDHFDEVANKFLVGFESMDQVLNDFRQTAKPAVQKVFKAIPSMNLPPQHNMKYKPNPSLSNPNKYPKNPAYAHNKGSYDPVLVVPTHVEDKREYVELLKRPLVRPVAIPTNSRTNIRYPEPEPHSAFERQLERHFFNDDEDSVVPRLAVQNQHHVQSKVNFGAQSSPQRISTVVSSSRVDSTRNIFDFKFNFDTTNRITESKEEDEKLDQYLRSTLRGEASLREEAAFGKMKEGSYDCYNSSCRRYSGKNNMQRLNNGILLGLNCVCEEGISKDRLIRKNSGNSKDATGSHSNTTEVNDSDEKGKEPMSFSKLNEKNDVKAPHVNKTGCFYSGWFKPKCSNTIKL